MTTTLIDGVRFETKHDHAGLKKFRRRIEVARQAKRELLNQLGACKTDATRVAIVGEILKSPDVMLACAIQACKDLPLARRPTLEQCFTIASTLKMDQKLDEPVRVKIRPKSSGGYRATCAFGPRHRTRQQIIREIMVRCFIPRKFQYTLVGVPPAIVSIRDHVGTQNLHVAKLDVSNCFGSMDKDVLLLNALPLPMGVVDHVVLGRHMAVVMEGPVPLDAPSIETLLQEARRGIPQGSICSPIIAAFILARLPWTPSEAHHATNYADDFFVISSSAEGLTEEVGKLTDAMQVLSGGKLDLRTLAAGPIADGAVFLGHHMQLVADNLVTTVSGDNQQYFFARLNALDAELPKFLGHHTAKTRRRAIKVLARHFEFVVGWCNAFVECEDVQEYRNVWKKGHDDWLVYHGVTAEQVEKAVRPHAQQFLGYGL